MGQSIKNLQPSGELVEENRKIKSWVKIEKCGRIENQTARRSEAGSRDWGYLLPAIETGPKNEIKTKSSALFSALTSVVSFGRSATLSFAA